MNREHRDQLVLQARPVVHLYLQAFVNRYPSHVREDAVADGMFSIFRSAERYDPTRQSSFSSYAIRRAIGAAADGLRARDHLPRSERRAHNLRVAQADAQHREPPSDGLPFSIDAVIPGTDGLSIADLHADARPSPEDLVLERDRDALLHSAIQRLPERLALVLQLYYFDQMTLAAIGLVLGVTESRASQLHTKALGLLRRNSALHDLAAAA